MAKKKSQSKTKSGKLLTTAEVCKRFGVSRRTVTNWVKAGLKVQHVKTKGGGRAQNRFDPKAVEDFLASENRSGKSVLRKSQKVPAGGAVPKVKTAAEPSKAASGDGARGGEDLPQILERLKSAERVTYAQWGQAVKRNQDLVKARKNPEYTAAALSGLQDNWKNMVEARRKFEKDLPGLMMEHQRYVDIEVVCRVWSRLFAATNADMDQIGISVADECAGKTANEIRVIVDDAVKAAKEHIRKGWQKLKDDFEKE